MTIRTTCSANHCSAPPSLLEPVPLCGGCAIAVALAVVPQILAVALSEARAAKIDTEAEAPLPVPAQSVTGAVLSSDDEPDRDDGERRAQKLLSLTNLEWAALDRLRSANRPLSRANIAQAVRDGGGTIATDRAGQIAVALKQHTVR